MQSEYTDQLLSSTCTLVIIVFSLSYMVIIVFLYHADGVSKKRSAAHQVLSRSLVFTYEASKMIVIISHYNSKVFLP